nr:hypothetical protein [Tanacetum cinerariifolium]
MDMTIDQQLALDEALVPHASRLRIGKSNFRLRSDITSRESTLQVVYDVLRLTPFYKAFLVTADVHEIYMQEFWATTTVHHHSIRFKMNNKKRMVNLEYFSEMLHICLRIPNQTFDELPFEEVILAFLRYLGHSREIKKIIDVKINKLHQPWRSFAAVINKCLSGKSTRYDSLWLSQAQILWGMYHKKNVDFAYLLWEDFVYQVDHKDAKKSNEMDCPKFSKVIINFFMIKDQSIPIRNKVNWHYVKDDQMFTTIKLVSRHQNTQQFGAMLCVELTNEDIRNSVAYKEYYAIALGTAPPKTKASVRKTQSSSDTTMPPPRAAGTRLSTSAKGKQPDKSSKAKEAYNKLTSLKPVDLVQMKELVLYQSDVDDDDDDDDQEDKDEQDDDEELYRDVNINLEGRDSSSVSSQFVTNMLNLSPDTIIDSLFESTHRVDVPVTTTVVPLLVTAPTLPPPSIPIISQVQQAPAPSPFAKVVSSIPGIVDRYIDHQMNEAVKVAVQLQSDRLRDEAQAENKDFLNKLDENIQKIIKEQVKEQVKVQVSKILPKIEKTVNEQLEAKVLTQASSSSKTSYVLPADRFELELKKILIEKMESNKSIHQSDEQRNLYKALVDAYEYDKIILDTYGDTGSKRRRAGKDPELTSALKEKASKTSGMSTEGSKSHQKAASESAPSEEPMQNTQALEEPLHQEFETGAADDQPVAEAS